jgi:hypothetical protein
MSTLSSKPTLQSDKKTTTGKYRVMNKGSYSRLSDMAPYLKYEE